MIFLKFQMIFLKFQMIFFEISNDFFEISNEFFEFHFKFSIDNRQKSTFWFFFFKTLTWTGTLWQMNRPNTTMRELEIKSVKKCCAFGFFLQTFVEKEKKNLEIKFLF